MSLHKIQSETFYQKPPQTELEVTQTQVFRIYISAIDSLFQTVFRYSTEYPKPQILYIFYSNILLDMSIIAIICIGLLFLLKKISNW